MVLNRCSHSTIKQLNTIISDTADSDDNEQDESAPEQDRQPNKADKETPKGTGEPDRQPNKADKETPKGAGDPDLPKITYKRKKSTTPNARKVAKTKQLESVMDKTIASFLQYQKEAEERYEEREEKRRQMERETAEKERQREREHELRLFAMMSRSLSPQPPPQPQRHDKVNPSSSTGEQSSFNISEYEPYSYYNL